MELPEPDGPPAGGVAAPTPATPPGRASRAAAYRPEIDGLRALAVLAVIANHMDREALPSGYLGVDIFFVISGFVISGSLASQPPQVSLGRFLLGFYSRRIRRILPALLACVVVTSVLVCLFDTRPTASLQTGLSALFGFSNLFLLQESVDYFARSSDLNAFLHTWSLGVEEQFYFVFPLLFWFGAVARGSAAGRRRLLGVLSVASALSLAAFVILARHHLAQAYFLMPSRFWELGAGSLLFLLHRSGRLRGAWQRLPSLLPLGLLLAALFLPLRLEVPATIAVVGLTIAVMAMGLAGADRRLVGLLSHPWAVGLGLLSYSLYLWHWPVLVLSRWTIGITVATLPLQVLLMGALAMGSFHWLEQPLRRRAWGRSEGGTIVIGLVAAGLAALAIWGLKVPFRHRLYLGRFHGTDRSEEWSNLAVPGTTIDPDVCNTQTTDATVLVDQVSFARLVARCSAEPAASPRDALSRAPHLYVVGDSHAMAFSPVAAGLLADGRYGISILSRPGCPFPDSLHGHLDTNCSRFLQATEASVLSRARPGDTVLIVNYLLSHLGDAHSLRDTRNRFRGADGLPISDSAAKWTTWRGGLARFASLARARGLRVVVLGATPRNPDYFTCRQEWFNLQAAGRCDGLVAEEQTWARQLNQRLAGDLPAGVRMFDPLTALCPKGCRNYQVTRLLRDTDHLSRAGARSLVPAFRRFLASMPSAQGEVGVPQASLRQAPP